MSGKVFDTADEGILVTDRDGVIQAVNPSFTRITGFNADESIGQEPGALLASGRHDSDYYQLMWYELVQKGRWSGEIWNRRKDGSLFPEWLSIAVVRNDEGEISGYVGVFSDITQRKKDEAQIRYQANYDTLTRLPNRTLLEERLNRALATARRDGRKVVLLFVDLDRFKHINDILGHTVGDELLQLVSRELQRCAKREVDTVARFGGDEFVILMEDVGQVDDAADIAERVVAALAKPFRLEGRELSVGASIGISIYPDDSGDAGALLRNADMAMYRAKELGRNNYQFFTSQMNEQVSARMELEQGLRHALNKGQFYLCYQPIVEGITGRLAAVEALLRWRHSELGLVSPVDFIPLAEETGAIVPIGLWVLQTACEQTAAWRQQGLEISVSVNVSGRQLANLDAGIVRQVLSNSGLPPAALKLEMTESLLIESEEALAWVDSMRALGVGLSLDDFGTGYSSLSYLKRFHMDILKVDRSFVSGLPGDMDDASLVKAILAMAGSLGLKVVAEGVETVEQYNCLKALGCDYIQGFLFSKPIEAGQIAEFAMKNSLDFSDNC
jgi:diguanylate cyclase (GGDEF)-like protein/PAS domain S-box-containing protein